MRIPLIFVSLVALISSAAIAQSKMDTLRQCGTIPSSPGEIHGEEHKCGDKKIEGFYVFGFGKEGQVQCGQITLRVPANETIQSYTRSVTPMVKPTEIGWGSWEDSVNITANGDGSHFVTTKFKNWMESSRTICLEVNAQVH